LHEAEIAIFSIVEKVINRHLLKGFLRRRSFPLLLWLSFVVYVFGFFMK